MTYSKRDIKVAMSIDLIKDSATFVVLVLVQGLVFNHIHLFNARPLLLYIIMVLHFRQNHPKWAVLLELHDGTLCGRVCQYARCCCSFDDCRRTATALFVLNFSYRVTAPTIWNRPCVLSA